jgi:hypothetical protein
MVEFEHQQTVGRSAKFRCHRHQFDHAASFERSVDTSNGAACAGSGNGSPGR